MLRHLAVVFFSLLCFSSEASNMIELSQATIIEDKNDSYTLIDVRTPQEFNVGHVPSAINIPLSDLSSNLESLRSIKGKDIVLYCRSGFRAKKAAGILQKNGISNIYHLEGDMLGWRESGLTVEK